MRLIATADIHGKQYRVNDLIKNIEEYSPEIVIICGDITHFGPGEHAKILLDQIPVKTLAVHGNIDDEDVLEYIDKSIKPAQKYYYRIRARSYNGVISAPSKAMMGYSKKLPDAIKWVKATDNRPRMINIIWRDTNPPGTIDHYNVYSSTLKDTLFSLIGSTKDMKYTDRFNSDGVVRYYKITAVDNDGLESSLGVIPTLGKTVGASRGPVINEAIVRHNAVFLQWSDPDGKARSYTVVKKFWDGWRARKIKITDFKSTKFTDTKIKPNVTYTYYVISVDKYGIESMPSREVVLSINSKR